MKKGMFFLISLLSILVLLVTMPAFSSFANSAVSYDYAKSGDSAYTTLSTVVILEKLLDTTLSDIEREYLSNADLTLNYSTGIPVSNINTTLVGSELNVNMKKYSYSANNGVTVSWTPISVNGESVTNDGDYSYSTQIDDSYISDTIDIVYRTSFSIQKEDINKHINSAYNYSESVYNKITAEEARYASEYSTYQTNLDAYNTYLVEYEKYQKAEADYQEYLKEHQTWLENDKAYKDYLVATEAYERNQKEYEDYLVKAEQYDIDFQKYQEYLVKYKSYQEELNQYNSQIANPEVQTALYQLEVLAYITKSVTDMKRTLSGAILGESVTKVLAEKEALVTLGGVEERPINLAANATESLRKLIKNYQSCKTDVERYAYYILSKDELSKGFNELLMALDFLYQYPAYGLVRRTIAEQGKTRQYEILLAQLFYMCNALTEDKLPNYITRFKGINIEGAGFFDSSYRIGESKRTPLQILGEAGIIEDKSNSTPLEGGYPSMPTKPVEPAAVPEPQKPTTVKEPIKPTEVAPAGVEPTAVKEPTKPTEVMEPTAPIEYIPTEKELRYKAAYENKVLQKRSPFAENGVLTIDNIITKYFRNAKTVTVRFFDGKSDTPILVLENQEIGSSVEYTEALPAKEKKGYTYKFDGWIDEDGNKIDINRLNTDKADLSLYPSFLETVNLYKVTWEVDNVNFVGSYEYGSVPTYSESEFVPLEKHRSGVRKYRFIGWESSNGEFFAKGTELPIMSDSERHYKAIFEESFVVTWVVNGLGKSVAVWNGEMPTAIPEPSKPADSTCIYNFVGWDSEVVEATKDATYTAIFETEYYASCDKGNVKVEKTDDLYQADCRFYGNEFNISTLLRKASEETSDVKLCLSDAELFIDADTVSELSQNAVSSIKLNLVIQSNSKLRFSVELDKENGDKYNASQQIELKIKNVVMGDNDFIKAVNGDDIEYVAYVNNGNELSLMVDSRTTYSICSIYSINTIATDGLTITTNKDTAEVGEEILINVKGIPEGKYIKSVYVVTEEGGEINVYDMTFTMPNGDVNVGVVLESHTYIVIFRANGKVILKGTYKHGETVTPPTVPDTVATNGNTLKFEGWDKEIKVVTENAEYQAKFTEVIVEQKEPEDTKLTKILKISYVVVPIVAALVIALVVVLVVVRVRKKKKKQNKKE